VSRNKNRMHGREHSLKRGKQQKVLFEDSLPNPESRREPKKKSILPVGGEEKHRRQRLSAGPKGGGDAIQLQKKRNR